MKLYKWVCSKSKKGSAHTNWGLILHYSEIELVIIVERLGKATLIWIHVSGPLSILISKGTKQSEDQRTDRPGSLRSAVSKKELVLEVTVLPDEKYDVRNDYFAIRMTDVL